MRLGRLGGWCYGIDPDIPVSRADLKRIVHELRSWRHPKPMAKFALLLLPLMLTIGLLMLLGNRWQPPAWGSVLLWLLMFVTFGFGGLQICKLSFGPHIRRELSRMGYDICERCGYWLRGLDDVTRCPECGAEREASL